MYRTYAIFGFIFTLVLATITMVPSAQAVTTTTGSSIVIDNTSGAVTGVAIDLQPAVTAVSGQARGVRMQQALTASANSDTLTGLLLNPTFNNLSFTGVTHKLIDAQSAGSSKFIVSDTGALALQGAEIEEDIGINMELSGALCLGGDDCEDGLGDYDSGYDLYPRTGLRVDMNATDPTTLYVTQFYARTSTDSSSLNHPSLYPVRGQSIHTGDGRVDVAVGGDLGIHNGSSGLINEAYMVFGQTANEDTGQINRSYGIYSDTINISETAITEAAAFTGKVRTIVGDGGYGTVYGLNLSGWSTPGATVTNSYGIFMNSSIDVGTTRYALYSSSTSQSYLQGNLGIGIAVPTAKLEVKDGHYASSQTTPPTPSVTGAGYANATLSAGSTDTKGAISATVGAGAGTLVVTFNSAYATAPVCTVSAGNAAAQVDSGKVYQTTSTGALTLNFIGSSTGGSETWSYICVQ